MESLGPRLKARFPGIKLMVHDDQVYSLRSRLEESGAGLLGSDFVDGVAYHWYGTVAGSFENSSAVGVAGLQLPFGGGKEVREIYEAHIRGTGRFMLATEASNGFVVSALHTLLDHKSESNNRGVRPGDWHRGFRYSKDIFFQLSNGASGWVDWNLLLDSSGGPNWARNNIDAPVLVGTDNKSLWVSPMYFAVAHWSKFVPPGSIALTVHSGGSSDQLQVAAFLRPDQKVAVVVVADELDGHGDPPPNQMLNVTIAMPTQRRATHQVRVVSGSIATAIFS